jgi:light-regulated signal transduction histidine kinase (bacteriophytochrome)
MNSESEKPAIDLTNCETEPIRYSGSVQPHGALLVVEQASGRIEAASESCATILGLPAKQLLGQSLGSQLGPDVEKSLLAEPGVTQPLIPLTLNGRKFSAHSLRNETSQTLIEIESGEQDASAVDGLTHMHRTGLDAMRQLSGVAKITQAAAELVRAMTGFDQVMIYRFDKAWNGEIIAEAVAEGVTPYLGLNFPASDIPKQARELFQLCKVRSIPDVLYTPSDLLARTDCHTIDLGRSGLRSVSPIHIEYLTFIARGVVATPDDERKYEWVEAGEVEQ